MVWGHVKQIPSKVNIISSIITLPKPKLPLWEPAFQNYLPLIVLKSVDGTKHDKHTYLNIWCFHFGALKSTVSKRPINMKVKWSCSVLFNSLRPYGRLEPGRLLCPWDFPGNSPEVDCHFLLQGIFPTQGSNLGLPHYRQMLYCLSHQEVINKKSEVKC